PSVTACMLARTCERSIVETLAHVSPFVDEVIVLDLGSQDQTAAIAREYGARVYHHPWGENFAAARNQLLRRATSDWALMLAPGAVIDELSAYTLKQMLRDVPEEVCGIAVDVAASPGGRSPGGDSMEIRLFRNRNEIVYEFRAC